MNKFTIKSRDLEFTPFDGKDVNGKYLKMHTISIQLRLCIMREEIGVVFSTRKTERQIWGNEINDICKK